MTAANVHASCIVIASSGVLIRGASGSGKSSLGDEAVAMARALGRFAAHVADDRVAVEGINGRLIARAPQTIEGLWERRGVGICRVEAERFALVRLAVDLLPLAAIERLPDEGEARVEIAGVSLPCLRLAEGAPLQGARRVVARVLEDTMGDIGDFIGG